MRKQAATFTRRAMSENQSGPPPKIEPPSGEDTSSPETMTDQTQANRGEITKVDEPNQLDEISVDSGVTFISDRVVGSGSDSGRNSGEASTEAMVLPVGGSSAGSFALPGSGGSTGRQLHADLPGPLDAQQTVISKKPLGTAPPPTHHMHPTEMGRVLQGQTLGYYELLEFVGGGGMGAVFRSLDKMLNRIVAVKVLSQDQSSDEETLRRFKNEAQSAARLDHENIGRVHYVGEDAGWHFIVFEFIEGINLRALVERDGPLSIVDTVNYLAQLSEALDHASGRDVVHRDIKPSNVLITPEGKAKLVDMGLARLHQVEHGNDDLTASGVTLGTFDYISPEQARDPRSADARSDMYSLGCTLYFMLTGRPPFPTGTVLQKLLQHQGDEPADPRQFCPELPDDLSRVLKRLLAKQPEGRYATPADLIEEVSAISVRLGLRPLSAPGRVNVSSVVGSSSYWGRHLPWLMPLAALILIATLLNIRWNTAEQTAVPSILGNLPPLPDTEKAPGIFTPGTIPANGDAPAPDEKSAAIVPKDDSVGDPLATESELPLSRYIGQSVQSGKQLWVGVWDRISSDLFTDVWPNTEIDRLDPTVPLNATASKSPALAAENSNQRTLIVAGTTAEEGQFATLAAALREAKTGDVIELRVNGYLDEEPIDISNLQVTIRSGANYQPIVRFQQSSNDMMGERRALVAVNGGQLSLHGVHIQFEVPRGRPAERWSLFELNQANTLLLSQCTITIQNSLESAISRPNVSIVDLKAGLAAAPGEIQGEPELRKPIDVRVEKCLIRGEATFLRSSEAELFNVLIDNSLLATSEIFVDAIVGHNSNWLGSSNRIEIRHSTLLVRDGLVRLRDEEDSSYLSPTAIKCTDSIIVGGDAAPLLAQVGSESPDEQRRLVTWTGERNVYENFTVFWKTSSSESNEEYSFRQWQNVWGPKQESNTGTGPAGWASFPANSREVHTLLPSDFSLLIDSPARKAASDNLDIGSPVELIPRPPVIRPTTPAASGEITFPRLNKLGF